MQNVHEIESDSLAAYKDAKRMEELAKEHPEWRSGGGKQNFLKHISSIGLSLEVVSSFCKSNNRPIPSRMPPQQRVKLVNYLLSNKNLLENLKGVGSSNQTENNEPEKITDKKITTLILPKKYLHMLQVK